LSKEISRFALTRGLKESPPGPNSTAAAGEPGGANWEDPRLERAMMEMERDLSHLDEHNPRHLAHLMRRMKDLMPADAVPKEMEVVLKRLESGEDPEKIEADMGDILEDFVGGPGSRGGGGNGGYVKDPGLYDY